MSSSSNVTTTRTVYLQKDKDFVYSNTCLLRVLTIKKPDELKSKDPSLSINNVTIPCTSQTSTEWTWDMHHVRELLRDAYDNNPMLKLDATLTYTSLRAIPHYTSIPSDAFQSSIFTEGLVIQFHLPPKIKSIKQIEIQEEVYISDVKK